MDAQVVAMTLLFAALAGYMLWVAYRIQYRDRTDLVRLGSTPLPGANLLKTKFAAVQALQGVGSLAAAAVLVYTKEIEPGIWLFAGVSFALAFRRGILVRAIEMHATSATGKSEA